MELYDLPPGWVWMTLEEITEINPRMGFPEHLSVESPISFVPMSAVDEEQGAISEQQTRPIQEVWKGYTRFQDGDVLFAKITPCMENGKAAIAENLENGIGLGSTEFHVLRPTNAVTKDWIYHFIRQSDFRKEARAEMTGTAGQLRVPTSFLKDYPIPLPPLSEQERIVEAIEAQLSRIEAGMASVRNAQRALRRYKASVLNAACTGQLLPQDPTDEPAALLLERILAERRERWEAEQREKFAAQGKPLPKGWQDKYPAPAAPATTDLPDLPEGWIWASWEQLSPRVTVGHVGKMKDEYLEEGIPFLRGQNVRENRFDPEGLKYVSKGFHEQLGKSKLNAGDLVVVRSGAVGTTCVIPDTITEANCSDLVIIKKPSEFHSEYGAYYMNSLAKSHIRSGQVGVALIHFNTQSVAEMAISLPPLAEQSRIVAEVGGRLSVVAAMEQTMTATLQRAARLRQSILRRAFQGLLSA